MRLLAPQTYEEASEELKSRVCNGCGPAGLIGKLVPEKLAGAGSSEACNIHDWMYQEGEDKQKADLFFLANMIFICSLKSKWLLPLRAWLAVKFFLAVFYAGDEFFNHSLTPIS
ncbi:MAG: hypothetical protein ACERJ1_17600 [Halodesulfovibrio sp.]|uniref:hypothetical protein n=1 Tax=Halodesulfovibrio sp. TaxID=1912772 RepID=UPI00359D7DDA